MAAEAEEKKPGFFARLWAAPKKLSLAGYWSCLTSVLLILTVTVVWIAFYSSESNVTDALSWTRIVMVLVLVVVIPCVLYKGLKFWLEGDRSRFPDINYAWEAGIEALRKSGLSLDSVPVFLVLGSTGEKQERAFMMAAGGDFRVQAVPEGASPLRWYGGPNGVYVFCTEASWLSSLAVLAQKKPLLDAGGAPVPQTATVSFRSSSTVSQPFPAAPGAPPSAAKQTATLPPVAPPSSAPAAPPPSQGGTAASGPSGRGTVMLDQFLDQQPATPAPASTSDSVVLPPSAPPASAPPATEPDTTGGDTLRPVSDTVAPAMPVVPELQEDVRAIVPTLQASEQLQRLQYVCNLLRHSRQPLCSLNGILTLLPFQMIQASPEELDELQRAIKSDLLTVQRELQLRTPVISLVVGLDHERGFSELVRRVGPDRAATQRFGRGFDVRIRADRDSLLPYCEHVCGTFEDWVHTLLREQDALARPGNTRLYGLLCKVRCHLKARLGQILAGGYGYDEQQSPSDFPFLYSGCYFAATGQTPDRQAFVKGVMDKMVDEQEYVEWTRSAINANRRYAWLAIAGTVASLLLVAAAFLLAF